MQLARQRVSSSLQGVYHILVIHLGFLCIMRGQQLLGLYCRLVGRNRLLNLLINLLLLVVGLIVWLLWLHIHLIGRFGAHNLIIHTMLVIGLVLVVTALLATLPLVLKYLLWRAGFKHVQLRYIHPLRMAGFYIVRDTQLSYVRRIHFQLNDLRLCTFQLMRRPATPKACY